MTQLPICRALSATMHRKTPLFISHSGGSTIKKGVQKHQNQDSMSSTVTHAPKTLEENEQV